MAEDPLELLVDEVVLAVEAGDVGRLSDFVLHPAVRITQVRMAFQVVGCGEAVVGHIPASSELLVAVAAAAYGQGPDS